MGKDAEEKKRRRAVELLLEGQFGLSAQVLAEFFNKVTRKSDRPLTIPQALEWIERLAQEPVVPVDVEIVRRGISIASLYQISYWDGAIIAAAERLGVDILYTEDLSHGQNYGSVRAVNPFV